MKVREERTGWRDNLLDKIHNDNNLPLPIADMGFLCLEYDNSKPVAIINYEKWDKTTSSEYYKSKNKIAKFCNDRELQLPFFEVRYLFDKQMSEFKTFKVIPLNFIAKTNLAHIDDYVILLENEFVMFLYSLRHKIDSGMLISAKLRELSKITEEDLNNWEYQDISNRHRDYGWDVPVVDIDFISFEENKHNILIEYKENNSFFNIEQQINHPTMKALRKLADDTITKTTFYVVRYISKEKSNYIFYVNPINQNTQDTWTAVFKTNEYFVFLKSGEIPSYNKRYYLKNTYNDRVEIKELGAKYDGDIKQWYYINPNDKEKFKKWL